MNQDPYNQDYHSDDAVETVFVEEHEEHKPRGYWYKIGGGSLTISIILHAVFVIVAIFLIWFNVTPPLTAPPPDFMPGGGGGGGGGEKMALKKQRTVTHAQPKMKLAAVSSNVALPNVSSNMTQMPALTMVQMGGGGLGTGDGGGRGSGSGTGVGSGIGSGWGPGRGAGFIALPPVLRSRCSPQERTQKMKENGGNDQCEAAVKKTLKWLKEKQNKDGSWGESHKGGMTGLALLAYLGHCETPESPVYGETVLKGLTFIMELGAKNKAPFDGIYSENPGVTKSTYEHGIATYAMGEMYSFSKLGTKPIPNLRESFEKGALIIINKQAPNGAWGYKDGIGYDPYGGNDLSVTGWQYQALKAAKHTNLKIPGLPGAIKKVESYLEGKQTADGGFGEANHEGHYNQWNLTGAALLGLQTLGVGNAAKISKGIKFLTEDIKKEPRTWNTDCYLYTWYYDTQALFQKGGESWKLWNDQFQKEVLSNQNDDGSYKVESVGLIAAAGSGAAAGDKDVYRACLCTLMLEVYYRYLKVGDRGNDHSESGLMPIK
jgi:hypothetical protein